MSPNTLEQQIAIESDSRFLAIIASAGSGKTRTLVQRISKEIFDFGMSPSEIIAFTFTRKAAEDLKTKVFYRVSSRIDPSEFSKMFVGTIHEYCYRYLKELDEYSNFDVLDELQLESLVYRLHDELDLDSLYGYSVQGNVQKFIKDYEVYENELLQFEDFDGLLREKISKFCDILRSNRLFTFGSMIRWASQEIEKKDGLEKLKHLFVDEYQDINPAQDKLIKTMVQQGSKLTVVGDDLQCIYQWRGSDVNRIINFKKQWLGETHILSKNFRSRRDIVEIAANFSNTIDPRFKEKNKKMIPTVKDRETYNNTYFFQYDSEENQLEPLIRIIRKALNKGFSPKDIAILVRSVRTSGQPIIRALNEARIPVFCPQISVIEGSLINRMFVPLFRLFSLREPRNQEEETAQDVLFTNFITAFSEIQLSKESQNRGLSILRDWSEAIKNGKYNAYNIRSWLYRFFEASDLKWDTNNANLLIQIGFLTRIIRSVEETNRRNLKNFRRKTLRTVYSYLSYILERSEDELKPADNVALKNVNAVFLFTVHQAKGLEFPLVLVVSIADGRFPVRTRSHGTSFSDKIASRYGTSETDERRLFYVALTRARDHLILLSFLKKGEVSPFLLTNQGDSLVKLTESLEKIEFVKSKPLSQTIETITSIGISDLLMLMECPFQYYMRRVFGIYPKVGDELGYGRSLHVIIQRSIKNGIWKSPEEIEQIVENHTHIPMESNKQLEIHKNAIKKCVKGLSNVNEFNQIKDVEIPIRFFFESFEISGIVDTYEENENGEITLIDWKTSISTEFIQRYLKQLQLYAYALRKQNMKLKGAKIIDVKLTSSFKKTVKIDVPLDREKVEETIENMRRELLRLRSLDFEPYPSETSCEICDVKEICGLRWEKQ